MKRNKRRQFSVATLLLTTLIIALIFGWWVNRRHPTSVRLLVGAPAEISAISLSPDNNVIAAGNEKSDIEIWNVKAEKLVATLKGHRDRVRGVAFSNNGTRLTSVCENGEVIVWDLLNRSKLSSFFVPGGRRDYALSQNAKYLGFLNDSGFQVLDLASKKMIYSGRCPQTSFRSMAISSDGKTLAFPGGNITLVDAPSGKASYIRGLDCRSVAISNDSKTIAATSDRVRLIGLKTGELVGSLKSELPIMRSVAFSDDMSSVAVGCSDGVVQAYLKPPPIVQKLKKKWVLQSRAEYLVEHRAKQSKIGLEENKH